MLTKLGASALLACAFLAPQVVSTPVDAPKFGVNGFRVPRDIAEKAIPQSMCSDKVKACCYAANRSDGSLLGDTLASVLTVIEGLDNSLLNMKCVPINLFNIGQNECAELPVCCEHMEVKGTIGIGCVPITVGL
ncbi:hypothetical protein ONZ45_g9589 [Pleurotus djamor]|nr:hypothetical protein ONZ45_g9589 [Pleurotus djamor]